MLNNREFLELGIIGQNDLFSKFFRTACFCSHAQSDQPPYFPSIKKNTLRHSVIRSANSGNDVLENVVDPNMEYIMQYRDLV